MQAVSRKLTKQALLVWCAVVGACDEEVSPMDAGLRPRLDAAAAEAAVSFDAGAADARQPVGDAGRAYSDRCGQPIDRHAPVLSNGFGFGLANTRNQPSAIDARNVARLQLAYAHAADGATGKRCAPAVTEQAVFFSAGRELVAMNRQSGCVYWTYSVPDTSAGALLGNNLLRASSVYLVDDDPTEPALVIGGDSLGFVYAVDAQSGKEVWKKFLGTMPEHHWITGSFQHHAGKLFVPYASKEVITTAISFETCCGSHGLLQAVDVYTGQILWTYHTTPEAELRDSLRRGPSGAGTWGVPAIDPARNTVYLGTGQNYTPPVTTTSDAIIALNMDDGSVRWTFQAYGDDAWNASCELPFPFDSNCVRPSGHDFDFGAPPVLVERGGRGLVLAADKGGGLYCLDAQDGSVVWQRKVGKGSALGGVHWGLAVDERNVYVAVADTFVDKTSVLGLDALTSLAAGRTPAVEPVEGGTPGLYAFELETGQPVWSARPTHEHEGKAYVSVYSAALSVTNDVLFAGALDGELRAFHTRDGSELWRFDSHVEFQSVTGTTGHGGTIDSVGAVPAGDMLFLNSGYDNFGGIDAYQAGPGNGLFVFRLPAR